MESLKCPKSNRRSKNKPTLYVRMTNICSNNVRIRFPCKLAQELFFKTIISKITSVLSTINKDRMFVTYVQSHLHKVVFYQSKQALCTMVLCTSVKFVQNHCFQIGI